MKTEMILAVRDGFDIENDNITDLGQYAVIAQREWLETNKDYRQILPYLVLRQENTLEDKFLLYRRVKGSGESRLLGKYSIGVGGHIDACDLVFNKDNTIDVKKVIGNSITRELNEETDIAPYFIDSLAVEIASEFGQYEPTYLKLSGNDTDLVHLGLATVVTVETDVQLNEKGMEKVGWFTAKELHEKYFNDLENWSKYLIEIMVISDEQ